MPGDTTTLREKTHIRLPEPQRSWLTHCTDAWGNLGVCVIEVCKGSVAVYAPDDSESFTLSGSEIAQFRVAYDEAIQVAEADLRARAAAAPRPS